MSLEFVRLDTSKPCDSRAIVSRRKLRGAALAGADVRYFGKKEEGGRVRCYPDAGGGVSRQCDEVKAMMGSGMIAAIPKDYSAT